MIAQGLKKAGIAFEIFEKDSSANAPNRTRDWSMALHWGSQHFENCIPDEILKDIRYLECDPYYEADYPPLSFSDAQTGELVLNIPSDGVRRASRKKMRNLFSRGLPIQYNKRLASFAVSDITVTVTFEDGTSASGSHLVGADGAKSLLRTELLGEKAALTPMPYILYNFKTSYTAEQARFLKENPTFHPIMNFGTNQELKTFAMVTILDVADKNKPETWIFQLVWSIFEKDPESQQRAIALSNEEKLDFLQSKVDLWTDPWKSALEWVPKGTEVSAVSCLFNDCPML